MDKFPEYKTIDWIIPVFGMDTFVNRNPEICYRRRDNELLEQDLDSFCKWHLAYLAAITAATTVIGVIAQDTAQSLESLSKLM